MPTLARLARTTLLAAASLASVACSAFLEDDVEVSAEAQAGTLHDLTYETLSGEPASFADLAGRVVLIVNTASECGYTPQYAGLQQLHEELADEGLVVIGFPCDDFGGQEPGDALAIEEFCRAEFGVTFPLAAKVRVKEGEGQSPVYAYLGGATGKLPGWNFGKYVVGKDGRPVAFFNSGVAPDDAALRDAIRAALDS